MPTPTPTRRVRGRTGLIRRHRPYARDRRADRSVCRMVAMTWSGSALIRRGVKCSTLIPAAVIRASRCIVLSQSASSKWYSRESTSAATPSVSHQASGMARKTSPKYRRGLYERLWADRTAR